MKLKIERIDLSARFRLNLTEGILHDLKRNTIVAVEPRDVKILQLLNDQGRPGRELRPQLRTEAGNLVKPRTFRMMMDDLVRRTEGAVIKEGKRGKRDMQFRLKRPDENGD